MVELDQIKQEILSYREPLAEVKESLDLENKSRKIEELEREMEAPGFWDDPEKANAKMKSLKNMNPSFPKQGKSWTVLFPSLKSSDFPPFYRQSMTIRMLSWNSTPEPAEQRAVTGAECFSVCIPSGLIRRDLRSKSWISSTEMRPALSPYPSRLAETMRTDISRARRAFTDL